MLFTLSREAIDDIFNRVFILAIVILSIAVLIFAFNVYIKSLFFF